MASCVDELINTRNQGERSLAIWPRLQARQLCYGGGFKDPEVQVALTLNLALQLQENRMGSCEKGICICLRMETSGDIMNQNRAKTPYTSKLFAFCASCSSRNDRNCRNCTGSGTCDGTHGSWLSCELVSWISLKLP